MSEQYKIIEGSPTNIARICDDAIRSGWTINGALHMVTIGERVIAFQGLVWCDTQEVNSNVNAPDFDGKAPDFKTIPHI